MKNGNLKIGAVIIACLALVGLLAPWLAPYDPTAITLANELQRPNAQHLLGCDVNGSDILSILIYGTRVSLEVGIAVTAMSVLVGLLLGSIGGYFGGWRDTLLTRILDIFFAFPGILLAIALASMLGPSKKNLIFCLAITSWAGYARLVRGEVLALRSLEYVEAARAMGLSSWRIFLFHLWPNLISPLLVSATFGLAGTVLAEASLSFLGIGMPPGTPSWGALLNTGRDVLLEAPHMATFPGLAIVATVLGFHLLGEGLRQRLDPKALH